MFLCGVAKRRSSQRTLGIVEIVTQLPEHLHLLPQILLLATMGQRSLMSVRCSASYREAG
jgi:hypothetical protein